MSDPVIRSVTLDDAPALTRLLEAFNGPPLSTGQVRSRLQAMRDVETTFLAEVDGEAVGFASLRVVPYLSDDAPYAELTELYVAPEHRRRGVGRALMAHAETLAAEQGAREILLLTGLDNEEAQAFYRGVGYGDYGLAMQRSL